MGPVRSRREIDNIYSMATIARAKLQAGATQPDHCLRVLCGHANMLDALMEDLTQTLEDRSSTSAAVEALLLDFEDDSEGDSDVNEGEPDGLISAIPTHDMPPSSIAVPATGLTVLETLHIRTSPQQVAVVGHAYDVAHSHKVDHFEPSLESITELHIAGEAESGDDEEEEALTPEDEEVFNQQILSTLPPPLVEASGSDVAKVEENIAVVDLEFGSTLEKVASRRDEIVNVG